MDTATENLARELHTSLAVRFGTSAPYAIGKITARRVGFASIPVVHVPVHCRRDDISALVPVVRQRIYTWLAERGIDAQAVHFQPSVGGSYRTRKFTDENETSASCGKNKMGCALEFTFEMTEMLRDAVTWRGSYGELPALWEMTA